MLNVEISKDSNKVKVIASGNCSELCSDLTQVFHALIQGMKEHGEGYDTMLKLTFLKGFDDGIIFDCTSEEMAEMREHVQKAFEKKSDGLLDLLFDKLKECLEGLDETK